MCRLKYFIIIFVSLGLLFPIQSQNLSSLAQKALREGYSAKQIEEIARQNGFSPVKLETLKAELSASQSNQGTILPTRTEPLEIEPISIQQQDSFPQKDNPNVFGINIFRSSKLTFTPNLNIATPKNYILGSGDQIHIELWGKSELTMNLTVRPDGFIKPDNLGPIYVNGLQIDEARKLIRSRLNTIYQGLESTQNQPASTFVLITLGQIRSIQVTVVGEVTLPGEYTLNSLSTIFTALHACGGPTSDGTLRSVQLIRKDKLHSEIDIYKFLTTGIKENDALLQEGDVILVQPYLSRVEVVGPFKKAGFFELLEGETLSDLIRYTSGFNEQAYKKYITVERLTNSGISLINVSQEDWNNFNVLNGDIVSVRDRNKIYTNRAVVKGAVKRPGKYPISPGMTLKQLIDKADGTRGDAYLEKVFIYRLRANLEQELLTYNLQDILEERTSVPLAADDVIEIKSIHELSEEPYITISGEIDRSGIYPFFDNMNLQDIIQLSGGLKITSNPFIEITRVSTDANGLLANKVIRIDLNDSINQNERLQAFDRIHVKRKSGFLNEEVLILGEVNSPGKMSILNTNERISSIISRAEGLSDKAYIKGAFLVRRNEYFAYSKDIQVNSDSIRAQRNQILKNAGFDIKPSDELLSRTDRINSFIEVSGAAPLIQVQTSLISHKDSTTKIDSREYEIVALDFEEIIKNPGSNYDVFVKPGDIISIPTRLQTVRVSGEVTSNVVLRYEKKKSYKEYVSDAGGFNRKASKKYSLVLYPNGKKARVKTFLFFKNYPQIEPGSTLILGTKKVKNPLNLPNIISSVGSVLGLIILVQRI